MLSFNEADVMNYGVLKAYAHENRKNMTEAESVLWQYIRRGVLGHRFLRQYIIGNYIVDFICRDGGLVIEVDGAYHSEPKQAEDDKDREEWMESQGYHIMRFSNEEILMNIESVLQTIESYFE